MLQAISEIRVPKIVLSYIYSILIRFDLSKVMGVLQIIQVMNDHGFALKQPW